MSNGYQLASGKAQKFEFVTPAPAGSLSSTADDMTKFMLAHLQGGQLGDARVLKPETTQLMHSRLFGLDPAANAMAYGFYEETRNGHRIVGHAGDTSFFHSDLHLVLGPGPNGRPVRFRVTLDGKPPGADHGMDTDDAGNGTVTAQRLYQLVRQANGSGERLFEITFLDPGVQAYAFTFG